MSDATKLRPEDLTSEERAIVDREIERILAHENSPPTETVVGYAWKAMEPVILARRALFAPATEKACTCGVSIIETEGGEIAWERHTCEAIKPLRDAARRVAAMYHPATEKVETTADRIAADLKAGTFRGAQPEPAAPVNGHTPIGEYDPDMKPAAQGEMPYELRNAVAGLRREVGNYSDGSVKGMGLSIAADRLESFWRTQSQPVAVGMTEELTGLLGAVDAIVSLTPGWSIDNETRVLLAHLTKIVRWQAAQGRKVELPKVREALVYLKKTIAAANDGWAGAWASLRSSTTREQINAALAEIDAAEGKRTAGEHMSELSGEPLPHYLRDARLTANGMRAAAEIARNFRPKSACTCGGYISFHNGVPAHQPGCLVGECLEIADEIDARADETDESLRE